MTADVGWLRIERLAPGEGQELGGKFRSVLRGAPGFACKLPLVGVGEHGIQEFDIGDNHRQNVVEVVSDAAGELADRLHLLRLAQLLLHLLAAGEVADEAGEHAPPVCPRFADRQFDREDPAILGDPLDEAAVADDPRLAGSQVVGQVDVMLGPIGLRHQHLDVAADHLVREVAEQSRRPGAERGNVAPLVDDDHRLGHGGENRFKVRFALRQLRLRPLQRGDVGVVLQDRDFAASASSALSTGLRSSGPRRSWRAARVRLATRRVRRAPRRSPSADRDIGSRADRRRDARPPRPGRSRRDARSRSPVENAPVEVMDDHDRGVEGVCEGRQLGGHTVSPRAGLVLKVRSSHGLARSIGDHRPPGNKIMARCACHASIEAPNAC